MRLLATRFGMSPQNEVAAVRVPEGSPRHALRLMLVAALTAVGVTGCGDSVVQISVDDVAELRVTPDSGVVAVGKTLQLRAFPLDSTGALISSLDVVWSSSAPDVAPVSETGLVDGVAVGESQVTASLGAIQTSVTVSVLPPPRIEVSQDTVSLSVSAGDPDPPPDTVEVTNGGTFQLIGLGIDSISYEGGADGWLSAQLLGTTAPTQLELAATTSAVTMAGTYAATVWLTGVDAVNSPAPVVVVLDVSPGAASAMVAFEGDGQEAAVGTAVGVAPAVRVTDDFGNGVQGEDVTFAVTEGGGSVTGATATTDADGVARVGSWTLGTATGSNTLTATTSGAAAVLFSAQAVAGTASSLELASGDGQTAVAGTAVAIPPAVVVRDGFGNEVPGATVVFEVTAGGGSVSGSPATSDADGLATVGGWTLGTVAGSNELRATVAGVADTVSFSATGVAGAAASMALEGGDAQSDTVGATLSTQYAVRVSDANGNGVAGVTVTWAVTGGGGSIGNLSTTDGVGIARATHTLGTTVGPQTVSASVDGLNGSPVEFTSTAVAGAPASVIIQAGDAQSATVGTSVAVDPAVLVQDASGNPVEGVTVTFAVTGGGGSVTGGSPVTDASGVAAVGSWTLGTSAGANSLSATVTGVSPVTFNATAEPGPATQLQLNDGDGQSAVAGATVSVPPSVRVLDDFGNGVAGTTVQFTVTGGGGSVTGATPTSDGSGLATVGSWTLGTSAGTNTLEASAAGIVGTVGFTATALSGSASVMALEAGDAQTDTVGATLATPYAVRVTDDNANPVAGVTVSWTVTGGGGSITPSSTTDANGVATAVRTLGTTAGTQTATGSVGGLTGSPVQFTATATTGAATTAAVDSGDGQSATVGTAVAVAPSVLVTDQFGNPVSGVTVTFAVESGGGSATGTAQSTDASGIAQVGSWTMGTTAGANTLSATATGLTPVTFNATATAGPATQLLLEAGDGQTATAGSPVAVEPAVRVLDAFGNAVQGETVTFAVTGGGGSLTGATPSSGAGGVATVGSWTLGTTAGTNTLRATVPAVADTVDFTATGVAGPAAIIALDGGNAQTDTVAATLAVPYTVLVTDANGNPVSGTTVTWSVTGGGGSITSSSVTNGSGIAAATRVLGTGAGTQTAVGSVGGLTGSPVGFTATATAGAPVQMTRTAGNGQSATVNTAVAIDPQVRVDDQFGNPVSGELVTFAVTAGGGSVSPTTAIATNASGLATVTSWTVGTVAGSGNNGLSATALTGGIAGSPATFTASATAGAPATITRTSTNNQTQITGQAVASPPTVRVEDSFGNRVGGVTVNFTPLPGGSVGSSSVTTNSLGIASTSWTVSVSGASMQTDGTFPNTLTAQAVGGSSPSTGFSADAVYSFDTHVNPIWSSAAGCTGCHQGAGTSGLALDGTASQNYSALYNVSPVCDPTLSSGYRRISPVGGTSAATDLSILMRNVDPQALGAIGTCADFGHVQPLTTGQLTILRAWVRNGAPNN